MRTYWAFLEVLQKRMNFSVVALVDLEPARSQIERYLEESTVKPEKLILLRGNGLKDFEQASQELEAINLQRQIHKIVIATEPLAHKQYIDWALARCIDVLVEKPVIAFEGLNQSVDLAREIDRYVTDLVARDTNEIVSVQAQRRYNPAYVFARKYLIEFVDEFRVPISFIGVQHEDGLWNSPREFLTEDVHPFKLGYGKILHSGYHFIDLFCWFGALNGFIDGEKWFNEVRIATEIFRPSDLSFQLRKMAIVDPSSGVQSLTLPKTLGEIDCHSLLQFRNNNSAIMTGRIDLLQNSVSNRASFANLYEGKKSGGARKMEELVVNVGPVLKVRIYSVDNEGNQPAEHPHMRVDVLRNSGMVGGKDFETFDFDSSIAGTSEEVKQWSLNQLSRFYLFEAFLADRENSSKVRSHLLTNRLISRMYENIASSESPPPYGRVVV